MIGVNTESECFCVWSEKLISVSFRLTSLDSVGGWISARLLAGVLQEFVWGGLPIVLTLFSPVYDNEGGEIL